MFPVFRSLSLRYLRLRWERAVLVVVSIALGVATLVSSRILNQCLEAAAHDTMTPIPTADLYVAQGETGVEYKLAAEIKRAKVPGVESVMPMIFEQVRIVDMGETPHPGLLLGVDPADLKETNGDGSKSYEPEDINSFAFLIGPPIYISEYLLKERRALGIMDTAPVKIRYAEKEVNCGLMGYLKVDKKGKAASFERNLMAIELTSAIKLLKSTPAQADRVSRIDIKISKDANREAVQQQVKEVVGSRAEVRTLEEQKKSTDDIIGGIQISFTLCSVGALVVGLFLVYNALSVSVAERRHDIGILRSLGATRLQVARLFASEAMLLGLTGAVLGVPLGIQLANIAFEMFNTDLSAMFLNPDIRPTHLSNLTMLAAVAAGVLTALLAALVPALQAAHDEPADAVRRSPSAYSNFFRRLHLVACASLIGAGVCMAVFRHWLSPRTGSLAMTVILIGLFLSMPILVRWTTRILQAIFRSLLGIEARLAADNLIRAPGRTGVVIGALAAGVSLMFQTAGVGRSNEEPIKMWVDQVIQADAFVFYDSLTAANSSLTPMRPNVATTIMEKVPDVERVVGLRFIRPEFRNTIICVVAIDAVSYVEGTRARLPNGLPMLERFYELPKGSNVVVSDNFAAKFGVKEGDTISIPRLQHGPVDLKIVGVGQDYTWSKGTIFLDRKKYVELFGDDLVDIFHVYFKPGADVIQTRKAVEGAVAPFKLVVEDKPFVREFLAGIIDKLYRLAYLQQFIIGVVAALGVVTALLISILQRRRELGLLRAVGATQPQVLKSVLAEAFLMGVIGTILGIILGLPMEWYLLRVVLLEESGFWFDMIIPWKEAVGIALIAVGVATIAGLIPAIHAVRLRIVDAIAYE